MWGVRFAPVTGFVRNARDARARAHVTRMRAHARARLSARVGSSAGARVFGRALACACAWGHSCAAVHAHALGTGVQSCTV